MELVDFWRQKMQRQIPKLSHAVTIADGSGKDPSAVIVLIVDMEDP